MKNAIALFIERHPVMTFIIVTTICAEVRDTVVGVSRAITGKYPPEKSETQFPKVDITVSKPKEGETQVVEGEVIETTAADLDPVLE